MLELANHGKKLATYPKKDIMKKMFALLTGVAFLVSCSNNDGQTGVMNDGMKLGDTNGGLADTAFGRGTSTTDTSKMEHRVDVSTRDTFNQNNR
jgi:hypothetical protein